MDRHPILGENITVEFACQVLTGLAAAHELQVVHRDLKPDNVFITSADGMPRLKLIDFGIAKLRGTPEFQQDLTRAGAMMGTPEYMAPEQLYEARDVDARADLYSLGVILYEMLSGERPADGDDAASIIAAVVAGRVRPLRERNPAVSEKLSQIVHRAIEAERGDRFESAHAMLNALLPLRRELSEADLATLGTRGTTADLPPQGKTGSRDGGRGADVPVTQPPDESSPPDTEDDVVVRDRTEDAALLAFPGAAPPASVAQLRAAARAPGLVPVPAERRRKTGRRSSPLILILSLLLLGLGSAIAFVVVVRSTRSSYTELPPSDPLLSPLPPATATPQVPESLPLDAPAPKEPVVRTPSRPGDTRPATPPAATDTPQLPPIAFPSALPPLPSSLPPLPSGFPTALPSFFPQIPGLTPPASSAKGGSEND
jgi:serine/threonine-protein kinase